MNTQKTLFSRWEYALAALFLLAVFALPQYTLGHNPTETIFALDPSRALSYEGLAKISGETDARITPIVIAYGAFRAYNKPPESGYQTAWTIWVPATAYSSTPDQTWGDPFITASGERVRDGIIAANFLPLHTKVRLPSIYGDKVFEVKDRMNSRYFYRVDVWMPTRWQALQFGLRNIPVEILY